MENKKEEKNTTGKIIINPRQLEELTGKKGGILINEEKKTITVCKWSQVPVMRPIEFIKSVKVEKYKVFDLVEHREVRFDEFDELYNYLYGPDKDGAIVYIFKNAKIICPINWK
jgi:hypothetical protein